MHFRHRWAIVSAEPYIKTFTFVRGPKTGQELELGEVTVTLQRCACGKTRTQQIEGTWTLEQLTKEVD